LPGVIGDGLQPIRFCLVYLSVCNRFGHGGFEYLSSGSGIQISRNVWINPQNFGDPRQQFLLAICDLGISPTAAEKPLIDPPGDLAAIIFWNSKFGRGLRVNKLLPPLREESINARDICFDSLIFLSIKGLVDGASDPTQNAFCN
jgi:hypothetical protein